MAATPIWRDVARFAAQRGWMTAARLLFLVLLAASAAPVVHAQVTARAAPPQASADESITEEEDEDEGGDTVVEELVVTGGTPRGAVVGDIAPAIQFDARDIRAYGANDLSELLEALAPQISSGRGRGGEAPVVLLNGRRISGFREVRSLPPEAIARIDVLPEEVALKYGYRADQKVVNIVLRRRFRALTAEGRAAAPTEGGRATDGLDLGLLRIQGDGRSSLNAKYQSSSSLLESERDLVGANPLRTLLPRTEQLSLEGVLSRPVVGGATAALNAGLDLDQSQSLLGSVAEGGAQPLLRDTQSRTGHLGLAVNTELTRDWRWTLTANADRAESEVLTAAGGAVQPSAGRVRSTNQSADAELVAMGSLFNLPAGPVSTTLKAQVETERFKSESGGTAPIGRTNLSRDRGTVQANLDLPLTSRRGGPVTPFGELNASANAELNQLSDFGALRTLNGGINWSPIEKLEVIASVTDEQGPPSLQQLGAPSLSTPNTPIFDFRTGQTADVVLVEGGNPGLGADHRRVLKLGATFKPLQSGDLTLSADYVHTRIEDPITGFPTATPEIEAAFAERFVRDGAGRLVQIDVRPVNFDRSDREEFRWGFNFSKPLRSAGEAGQKPIGPPRARSGGGGGEARGDRRRGGAGFGGRREGRLQLALYHTWRLRDTILIRDGLAELDLLNGSAAGGRGGEPAHQIELQAGVLNHGLGLRLNARWQSATFVRGDAVGTLGPSNFDFSSLATVDLRMFADLGQRRGIVSRYPWVRGLRASLSIDNLLDERLRVRDAAGTTPLSFQSAYLDPQGRTVHLTLRKLSF